jgi:hypothetical protein
MKKLKKKLLESCNDASFRKFQNECSEKVYQYLANVWKLNDIQKVEEMCNSINNFPSYKRFSFRAKFDFKDRGNKAKRELGNTVVVSVATKKEDNKRNIIYAKVAIIQSEYNKSMTNKWDIDQEQLHLLHNFPSFKGTSGIIKEIFQDKDVIFKNYSQGLGNYALFTSKDKKKNSSESDKQHSVDMIFINAREVYRLQDSSNKISLNDILKFAYNNKGNSITSEIKLLNVGNEDSLLKELPFLNNCTAAFNIHEFIHNWTLFNIGEPINCCVSKFNNRDSNLEKFVIAILKEVYKDSSKDTDEIVNGYKAMLVMHLDLDKIGNNENGAIKDISDFVFTNKKNLSFYLL